MCSRSLPAYRQVMERGNLGLNEVQSSCLLSSQTSLASFCTLIRSWLGFTYLSLWPLDFSSLQSLTNILFPISLFMRIAMSPSQSLAYSESSCLHTECEEVSSVLQS